MGKNDLLLPNRPPLTLVTGGGGGVGKKGTDWLTPLTKGTCFLSYSRGRTDGLLSMWTVWNKTSRSILLRTELNQIGFAWVKPINFCDDNVLQEILEEGKEDELVEGN